MMFGKNEENTETSRNESNTLSKQVESLAKTISDKGEKVSSDMASKLEHYRELASETMDKVYDAGSAGIKQVREYVSRKPMAGLLAAFGVGCAVSWLFRKSR